MKIYMSLLTELQLLKNKLNTKNKDCCFHKKTVLSALSKNDTYVTDIPDDLLRPCIRAIASEEGANVEIRGEF